MTYKILISLSKTLFSFKRFAAILACFAFISCSDEGTESPTGLLKVGNDLNIQLNRAYLVNLGESRAPQKEYLGNAFTLFLYNDGLNVLIDDYGEVKKVSGEGYILELNLIAERGELPAEGKYTFEENIFGDMWATQKIIRGNLYHFPEFRERQDYSLYGGSIFIDAYWQQLEIESENLMTTTNKPVTLDYQGKFNFYDLE